MAAHRRTSFQFCGQATASASSNDGGMAFVHQLVSFDDEMDVLVNSAHGSIAECDDCDDDDDDDAVRNAWSLLDDPDESSKEQRRHPRRRRRDDAPPPIVARESEAKLVVPSSIGRSANI